MVQSALPFFAALAVGHGLQQGPYSGTPLKVENKLFSAELSDESVCAGDSYQESLIEKFWKTHADGWTKDATKLCEKLKDTMGTEWDRQITGQAAASTVIFPKLCKASERPQILEPLVGLLRSPRALCTPEWEPSENIYAHVMDVDFLILADATSAKLSSGAKRMLFDAGGSVFKDATLWFAHTYAQRGIEFDHIFVWEGRSVTQEEYWLGTPTDVRAKWEPRVTYYSGTYVTADITDSENNVLERIKNVCQPGDFCAFKLDIDTPAIEAPLVQQLRDDKDAQAKVDEFFFEHHINNPLMEVYWGRQNSVTNATFSDSYEVFADLRRKGVRAHSWI